MLGRAGFPYNEGKGAASWRSREGSAVDLDIFFDVVCPWCWIGKTRLRTAIAEMDLPAPARIRYRSFELRPDMPPEGLPAEAFYIAKFGSAERVAEVFGRVTAVAATVGLDLRFDRMQRAASTRLAHRLIQVVQREGYDAGPLVEALFAANFRDGADVSRPEALRRAALAAGLVDGERCIAAVLDGYGDDLLAADRQWAQRWDVRSVPFFVADGRVAMTGSQEPGAYHEFLRSAVGSRAV